MHLANPGKNRIAFENLTRGGFVGTDIEVADTFRTRLVGLLGRRGLAPGEGLLLRPSSGVHTFAMRFPIDVVGLDSRQRIVALQSNLHPWRISKVSWRIRAVLELPPGTIDRCGLRLGDQLCANFTKSICQSSTSASARSSS